MNREVEENRKKEEAEREKLRKEVERERQQEAERQRQQEEELERNRQLEAERYANFLLSRDYPNYNTDDVSVKLDGENVKKKLKELVNNGINFI